MSDKTEISAELLIEALNAFSDGIAVYGEDGKVIFANKSSQAQFASFFQELARGKSFKEAVRPSIVAARPDATDEEIDALASFSHEAYVEGRSYDLRTETGQIVRAIYRPMSGNRKAALSIDITHMRERERELRKAREEAEQARAQAVAARIEAETASAAKSAFLANMSHEIRTPLNGILGMAQVLDMDDLSPCQRERVDTILDSGRHLMTILNDVLELSKLESGSFELSHSNVDLRELVSRVHQFWLPKAEAKKIAIRLDISPDVPRVIRFDPVRTRQCLENLLSNAVKFTDRGTIFVRVRAERDLKSHYNIEIEVEDTGIGMDGTTLARLFQPFAQGDDSTTRQYGGVGLGLAITSRLARKMGGRVEARSRPGDGTTVTFSFLAEQPSSSTPGSTIPAPVISFEQSTTRKKFRILIVDDNPINRRVVSLFVRPIQEHVVEAANGQEALSALGRETFDVVLLDMHMPVMDGPTTVKAIRAAQRPWSTLPVIALTADAMNGDKERYLAMGMDGYLAKPLSAADLKAEILRLCAPAREASTALAG